MYRSSSTLYHRSLSLFLVMVMVVALTPITAVAVRQGKTTITPIDNDQNGTPDAYEIDWDGDGKSDEEWSDPDEDGVIDTVAWSDYGDASRSPRGRVGMRVKVVGLSDGGQMVAIDWDGNGRYDEVWWDFDGDGSVDDTDIYETESKVVDNTKATRFRGVFVGVENGLDYPEKDVDDLTGRLAEYGASWDSADMNKLKGDAATPAAIGGAINAAKADSKPGDEFLFYFAGHGGGYDKDDGLSGGRIDTNGDETAIRIPESEFGRFDGSALTTPPAGMINYHSHDLDGDGTEDARTVRKSDGTLQVWTRNATAPPRWRGGGTDTDGDGDVDKDDGGVDMNGDGDKNDTVGVDDTILVAGKQKVTDDQLTQWLSGFPESVTIVVIIDACFSGSFVPDLANNLRDSAGKPLRPGHLEVITAAPADEPALEMPVSNGVLTQGLLNALTRLPASVTGGHDTSVADYIGNQDDRTTTRELFTWAGPSAVTYSNLNNDGDAARTEDGTVHQVGLPTSTVADDSLEGEPAAVDDTLGVTHLRVDDDEDGSIDEDPPPMVDSFFDVYYDPDFLGLPTPTFKTAFSGD
nr:caspase family protein [Actinomycetota bacterium]